MYAGLSDEQKWAIAAAAERSLRAREIISVFQDDNRIEIEPMTLASIGTCIYPQKSLSEIALNRDGIITALYCHQRDQLLVEHSFPEEGIYEFSITEEEEAVYERMLAFIGINDKLSSNNQLAFSLPISCLEELGILAAEGRREEATTILSSQGLDLSVAKHVSEAFESYDKSIIIARVDYSEQGQVKNANGFALLCGENGLWILTSDPDSREIIIMKQGSYKEVRHAIIGLVSP